MCDKFLTINVQRGKLLVNKATPSGNLTSNIVLLLYVIGIILTGNATARGQGDLISITKPNNKIEADPTLHHNSCQPCESSLQEISIKFLVHDILLSVSEEKNVSYIIASGSPKETPKSPNQHITNIEIEFNSTNTAVLDDLPSISVELTNHSQEKELELKAKLNGYTLITVTVLPPNMTDVSDVTEAFIRVSVYNSPYLDYLSNAVGWIYFVAWSISFYPQTWLNWRRKSVIGLHFDFLSLNTIGFILYSLFNIGLYFVPEVQREYFKRHPYGVNPVQLNDVIFSLHAFFACAIQVIQCVIYERGDQRISKTGRSLLGSFTIASIIVLILGCSSVIAWIDFLYFLSYIKLTITLIKYIPQAYYNYLRKSTSGWSIGNVLLDFTGGGLSICQMIIISYNYNDWGSIFGDPTKFGLGLFSVMFDIIFMVQHYVLYKGQENYLAFPDPEPVEHSNSNSYSQDNVNYGSISEN